MDFQVDSNYHTNPGRTNGMEHGRHRQVHQVRHIDLLDLLGLARISDLHRHGHIVILRWAWLGHGHIVLLMHILGHLSTSSSFWALCSGVRREVLRALGCEELCWLVLFKDLADVEEITHANQS